MSDWNVLLLAFAAAACWCSSMERHRRDVFGREQPPPTSRVLHTLAWLLAGCSYGLAVAVQGVGIGSIEWVCLFGLAAVAVGVLAAYRPRWLPRAGLSALMGAAGLAVF